ncbi:MAG: 3-dehydroquinate synthase [Acidobacteria bacterium]|nr:3-dehydroquinate synthase [Acidobacteriota bacterium]
MDLIRQTVTVTFEYPVYFTRGVFSIDNLVLREVLGARATRLPAELVVVADAGVVEAHPGLAGAIARYVRHRHDALRLATPVLVIPGGEDAKNDPRHLAAVHKAIHDGGLCRHSYVVAVGGGAVLDVAGYAAATAHRGIRLVRVPTTVLAQDDSGMGVKNGVNGFGKKNYYGTFAPPAAVINDFGFLATLEDRDWLGGLSEAIKVAVIKDEPFFAELERLAPRLVARDDAAMETVVRRSAALHLAHIAGADPFELGSSRPLDFGHWAAHKLEPLSGHRLRHGEAVSIGMALDATYSWLRGLLGESEWRRMIDLMLALRLPVYAAELDEQADRPDHPRSVFRGLAEFREHLGGELTVMLLEAIGRAVDVHEIETSVMMRAIRTLRDFDVTNGAGVCGATVAAPLGRRP